MQYACLVHGTCARHAPHFADHVFSYLKFSPLSKYSALFKMAEDESIAVDSERKIHSYSYEDDIKKIAEVVVRMLKPVSHDDGAILLTPEDRSLSRTVV